MTHPSVAVIVPTYNRAQMIGEAVECLLAQADGPDEIIVVDDGSTDETAAVLAGYGDRIRVIVQANAGVAAARNTGAAAATSDWLAFLDSDDLWRPGRMTQLRADLQSVAPEVVAHVANVAFVGVGDDRDLFSVMRIDVAPGTCRQVARPLGMFLHSFFLIGAAVRRDVFHALDGFDTSYRTDEDTELAHRLAEAGPFLVRGDVVAEVIRRPGDADALSGLRAKDPLGANRLKLRHFRGVLDRTSDPKDRHLAGQALSDALLQRAQLLRAAGQSGYWAHLWAAARSHPNPLKGAGKTLRCLLGGARRGGAGLDRTGGGADT